MKQDNSKQRLLEVMQRVDRSFKPKLNEEFSENTEDPTKEEMVNFIKTTFNGLGTEDMDFDIESAIYWFASDYHGGQWGNLYSMLSTSPFKPASSHSSINDEESEVAVQIYNALVDKYGGGTKEEIIDENEEEFIPHGSYTVSNSGGYEIMLSDAGDAARVRDAFGSDNPKTSDWLEIEYMPDEETGEHEPVIDPNGYNIPLNMVMRINQISEGGDDWIQKAVDSSHLGYCTPMSKETCTPKRKALAKRFKKGIKDESVVGEQIVNDGRPFDPMQLIRKAITGGYITPDEYFDNVDTMQRTAEEVADDYAHDDGGDFGSSDMTSALKSFLDGMGYQTDFVNNKLTRLDNQMGVENESVNEESGVYSEEQLKADFNEYVQQQNFGRGVVNQLWSDIYSAWYTNQIHSNDDLGIMMSRMNENKNTDNSKKLLFENMVKINSSFKLNEKIIEGWEDEKSDFRKKEMNVGVEKDDTPKKDIEFIKMKNGGYLRADDYKPYHGERADNNFYVKNNGEYKLNEIFYAEKLSPEMEQKIASEIPSIAANYQNRIDDNHIRTIITVLWENYGYKHYIKSFSELEKFVEDWVNKNMPEEVQRWKDYENTMGTFDAKLRNPIQNEDTDM